MAHVKPEVREGIVGPGAAFNAAFKEAEISYSNMWWLLLNENLEEAKVLEMVKKYNLCIYTGPL